MLTLIRKIVTDNDDESNDDQRNDADWFDDDDCWFNNDDDGNDDELKRMEAILCGDDVASKVTTAATTKGRNDWHGSKRLLIDGVAGAGKTFVLGVLLNSFRSVLYLVKKRSFVDSVLQRFGNDPRVQARTIDSYLMQHFGVRSLPEWLRALSRDHSGLKRHARPVARNDEQLIFVDEYSMIERSLMELLEIVLLDRRVIIAGDCNQQSAIGDSMDQPVRTILNFGRVCFMYDNVRTKDVALSTRLQIFGGASRFEDLKLSAIRGLPIARNINMRDFLHEMRSSDNGSVTAKLLRRLPRIIVLSNDRVNYINWSIGHLIWRSMTKLVRRRHCLRYRRKIVRTTVEKKAYCTDDSFADEHYVITGMRYRMIAVPQYSSCPVRVGSRVIVRFIESNGTVVRLITDDERAQEFRVRKQRVKPYEYSSKWREHNDVRIHMFPFVLDAATTVYQVQGLTLDSDSYSDCYIDVKGMDDRTLYVSLSRFQTEKQIKGIANAHFFF